jgi:hypothetical protein
MLKKISLGLLLALTAPAATRAASADRRTPALAPRRPPPASPPELPRLIAVRRPRLRGRNSLALT